MQTDPTPPDAVAHSDPSPACRYCTVRYRTTAEGTSSRKPVPERATACTRRRLCLDVPNIANRDRCAFSSVLAILVTIYCRFMLSEHCIIFLAHMRDLSSDSRR